MQQFPIVQQLLIAFYGMLALVGWSNFFLMRRPRIPGTGESSLVVLIPARNEESNLKSLLPALMKGNAGLAVYVYDDESTDLTAQVARDAGAIVVSPTQPLPEGWTGKNRACHELAIATAHRTEQWRLFLDADVQPSDQFLYAIRAMCHDLPHSVGVLTGFPRILPGRGCEPIFLAWVGWILLTSNPYGIVSKTGLGHNRFKNGQVHCWRKEVYESVQPNLNVRDQIMEDVGIGRLLARKGVRVEVANLSSVLSVRMYDNWRQTLDGMSKNSFEITGSVAGSVAVSLFFLLAGWGWLLTGAAMPVAYGLLCAGGLSVVALARTPLWPMALAPLVPTIGAFTVLRSTWWHQTGRVVWKGRTYPGKKPKERQPRT